jgi:uncharacterized protein
MAIAYSRGMLDLQVLPGDYAICRLPAGTPLPPGLARDAGVVSVTWTPDEVSVICPSAQAPADAVVESPWRCLRVAGLVELTLTGVLASLTGPLAEARVNLFAFSTYDTDYLLVPAVRLAEAVTALTAAGHRVLS